MARVTTTSPVYFAVAATSGTLVDLAFDSTPCTLVGAQLALEFTTLGSDNSAGPMIAQLLYFDLRVGGGGGVTLDEGTLYSTTVWRNHLAWTGSIEVTDLFNQRLRGFVYNDTGIACTAAVDITRTGESNVFAIGGSAPPPAGGPPAAQQGGGSAPPRFTPPPGVSPI